MVLLYQTGLGKWVSDAPMLARYADWILLLGLSITLGQFSPRVFTRKTWSAQQRGLFTAAVTVFMFFLAGIYRLSSGQEMMDQVQNHLICPLWRLPYCSDHSPSTGESKVGAPPEQTRITNPVIGAQPPPSLQPVGPDARTIEVDYWDSIKASQNAEDFVDYLAKYPSGTFASIARRRIAIMRSQAAAAAGVPDGYNSRRTAGDVSTTVDDSVHPRAARPDSTSPNMLVFSEKPTNYDAGKRPND